MCKAQLLHSLVQLWLSRSRSPPSSSSLGPDEVKGPGEGAPLVLELPPRVMWRRAERMGVRRARAPEAASPTSSTLALTLPTAAAPPLSVRAAGQRSSSCGQAVWWPPPSPHGATTAAASLVPAAPPAHLAGDADLWGARHASLLFLYAWVRGPQGMPQSPGSSIFCHPSASPSAFLLHITCKHTHAPPITSSTY